MSQAENPKVLNSEHKVSVEDIQALMGASTPHFALQIRVRIQKLIAGLDPNDPARILGEREVDRLEKLAFTGETRGRAAQTDHRPLTSLTRE